LPPAAPSVQPEEPRRRQEGQRDEEQPRVAALARRVAGRERQRGVDRRRAEHDPEVRRVLLPLEVQPRRREQQPEAGQRDRQQPGDERRR